VSVDLASVRERLVREADEVRLELSQRSRSSEDAIADDVADDDTAQDLLAQYESALVRVDAGSYGVCTRCGQPIDEQRLAALPYVALCITDARVL
jgi:DnaK suppressor protein